LSQKSTEENSETSKCNEQLKLKEQLKSQLLSSETVIQETDLFAITYIKAKLQLPSYLRDNNIQYDLIHFCDNNLGFSLQSFAANTTYDKCGYCFKKYPKNLIKRWRVFSAL
jgi:hypothetical protein